MYQTKSNGHLRSPEALRDLWRPFEAILEAVWRLLPTLALCKLYTNVLHQNGVTFFQESTGQGFRPLLVIVGCFRGRLEAI